MQDNKSAIIASYKYDNFRRDSVPLKLSCCVVIILKLKDSLVAAVENICSRLKLSLSSIFTDN